TRTTVKIFIIHGSYSTEQLLTNSLGFTAVNLHKLLVVLAGPGFNIVFAAFVFWFLFMAGMPVLKPVVGEVLKGTPAERAGIQEGDEIVAIDGSPVSRWEDVAKVIKEKGAGAELTVKVRRGGEVVTLSITPELRKVKNIFGEEVSEPKIGIVASGDFVIVRHGPFESLYLGARETVKLVYLTVMTVVKLVERVVPFKSLGGPILIAQLAGDQAKQGPMPFFYFLALLSVNLGILNLLPIPILDGGHIVIYSIEAVTGRQMSLRVRGIVQQIGLVIIITLAVLVFYNDIARIFTK
ncbi:MAG: RIP metalloprotease RseP, partial [Deltaproteobacteria bacterium]